MIRPGKNIALKVPLHKWAETVAFYRDKLKLPVSEKAQDTIAFVFGDVVLWIDRVDRQSQVDVWLELESDDPEAALETLQSPKRDELEPLDGDYGHFTSDPAGVVFFVKKT